MYNACYSIDRLRCFLILTIHFFLARSLVVDVHYSFELTQRTHDRWHRLVVFEYQHLVPVGVKMEKTPPHSHF